MRHEEQRLLELEVRLKSNSDKKAELDDELLEIQTLVTGYANLIRWQPQSRGGNKGGSDFYIPFKINYLSSVIGGAVRQMRTSL